MTKQIDLLEQRALIDRYLKEADQPLSSFSFINFFIWKDFFNFEFKMIGGNLCIFASGARDPAGTFLYLPPLGKKINPSVIEECFAIMRGKNNGSGVSRIENVPAEQLPLFPDEKFRRIKKGDEYCYYRKDLAALQGNDYKSKRSDYNFFTKHYNAEYQPFSSQDTEECLALYDRWAQERKASQRDEAFFYMLVDNRKVHATVFQYCEQLGLAGRVVRVDGEIAGYTFGYNLNQNIFCVLCEIADVNKKGLPVYIFRKFCEDPQVVRFPFINVMDDFALENIQKTKMSFHPTILFSSYTVSLNHDQQIN